MFALSLNNANLVIECLAVTQQTSDQNFSLTKGMLVKMDMV